MTSRISPHAQSPHTTIDYLAALTQSRISSGYLRIPCPAHGGTNPNLALWVNDDGIAARCHSAGCSYADIAKAIEDPLRDLHQPQAIPRQSHRPGPQAHERQENTRTRAKSPGPPPLRPFSSGNTPSPFPNPHVTTPLGMWLAARQLWCPELPLPGSVRWIGAEHLRREFQGAGAIIAMASPPAAWTTS